MGTSLPLNELPGSPLSAGYSGVNSRGQRSQDHRLHNASDCWLLMLKWVLRGGVDLCVFCLYLLDCAYIYSCVTNRVCELGCMHGSLIFTLMHPDMFTCVLMHPDTLSVEGGTWLARPPWQKKLDGVQALYAPVDGDLDACLWGGEFNFLPLLGCAVWIAWLGIGGRLCDTPDYPVTESLLRKCCLIFGAPWLDTGRMWHSRKQSGRLSARIYVCHSALCFLRQSLTLSCTVLLVQALPVWLQIQHSKSTAHEPHQLVQPGFPNEDMRLFTAFPEVVRVVIVTPLWIVSHYFPVERVRVREKTLGGYFLWKQV